MREWCLVDCFHREFRVSTQIMVRDYLYCKMEKVLQAIFLRFKIFALITNLQEYDKMKKKFLHMCISKILLMDTEQFS